MPSRSKAKGCVVHLGGRVCVRWPNGRKTAAGNTSYDVRTVSSETKGVALLRALRAADKKGAVRGNSPSRAQGAPTIAQAVRLYIDSRKAAGRSAGTVEQYEISLRAFKLHGLSQLTVTRAQPDDISGYLAWRKDHILKDGKPVRGTSSNAVLFRDRGLLSATYRWLIKRDRAEKNPVAKTDVPKKRKTAKRPFDQAEVAAFLGACHPIELRPMVVTGLFTGLGSKELVNLRWREISFGHRAIYVVRQKNQDATIIPLHPELATALQELREHRARTSGIPASDDHVFLSRFGTPYQQFPKQAWTGAIRRAGLTGRQLSPHGLRRTFATFFEGQDRDLQKILGHSDLATTLLYRRARDERARAGVEAIDYGLRGINEVSHPDERKKA